MFLPALTVALGISPILIRSLRASLLNVLESDYIMTARAKGISERRVMFRHALRNGDHLDGHRARHQPRPSWSAPRSWSSRCSRCRASAQLMLNSIFQRDFPVVQGVTLVFAIMVVVIDLAADMLYAMLDPRVRFD